MERRDKIPQVSSIVILASIAVVIVALYLAKADLTKARERIGCGAVVVSTLAEAQEQVRLLIQPHQANSPPLVNAIDKPL